MADSVDKPSGKVLISHGQLKLSAEKDKKTGRETGTYVFQSNEKDSKTPPKFNIKVTARPDEGLKLSSHVDIKHYTGKTDAKTKEPETTLDSSQANILLGNDKTGAQRLIQARSIKQGETADAKHLLATYDNTPTVARDKKTGKLTVTSLGTVSLNMYNAKSTGKQSNAIDAMATLDTPVATLKGVQSKNAEGTKSTRMDLSQVMALGILRAQVDVDDQLKAQKVKLEEQDKKNQGVLSRLGNFRRNLTGKIVDTVTNGLTNALNAGLGLFGVKTKPKTDADKPENKPESGMGLDGSDKVHRQLEKSKKEALLGIEALKATMAPDEKTERVDLEKFLATYQQVTGSDFDLMKLTEDLKTRVDVNGKPLTVQNSTLVNSEQYKNSTDALTQYTDSNSKSANFWGPTLAIAGTALLALGGRKLGAFKRLSVPLQRLAGPAVRKWFKTPSISREVTGFLTRFGIGGSINAGLQAVNAKDNGEERSKQQLAGDFLIGGSLAGWSIPGVNGLKNMAASGVRRNALATTGLGKANTFLSHFHKAQFGQIARKALRNVGLDHDFVKAPYRAGRWVWNRTLASGADAGGRSWRHWRPLASRAVLGSTLGGAAAYVLTPEDTDKDGKPLGTHSKRLENTVKGAAMGGSASALGGSLAGSAIHHGLPRAAAFLNPVFPQSVGGGAMALVNAAGIGALVTAGEAMNHDPHEEHFNPGKEYLNNVGIGYAGRMWGQNLNVLEVPFRGSSVVKEGQSASANVAGAVSQLAIKDAFTDAPEEEEQQAEQQAEEAPADTQQPAEPPTPGN